MNRILAQVPVLSDLSPLVVVALAAVAFYLLNIIGRFLVPQGPRLKRLRLSRRGFEATFDDDGIPASSCSRLPHKRTLP